ncbi:hypothetical protein E3O19_16135 [Cryobacterium algoritolerans]|uniref:Uncharacterized protein n=1 Tax=Cryobacterium algoritolerans TaxID=1259184 RepID=A0A4R8WMW4_9MICO|nr:hypothetical protein [Cryobacterium algoritolerans]TFC09871.1 hypothetical protein E3O19_16135 [Cryobacterium algoritolerans]
MNVPIGSVRLAVADRLVMPDLQAIEQHSNHVISHDSKIGRALVEVFGLDVFASAVIRIERIHHLEAQQND